LRDGFLLGHPARRLRRHLGDLVGEHGEARLMVGCEHRSAPLSGSCPTAILMAGSDLSASQLLPSG
jgi:hypothetical protein